jgi:Tfp pilus assembly ATPase PilU
MRQMSKEEWAVEEKVTFFPAEERHQVKVDLTKILLNPPKWH